MVISTCANIFTNYEDFFPTGRQIHLLRFVELQPQQQHGEGRRWRCWTSITARSGARGEKVVAEGASEQEMSSLALVLCQISLSSVSSSSTYRYVL
jgi:hypothetical protein